MDNSEYWEIKNMQADDERSEKARLIDKIDNLEKRVLKLERKQNEGCSKSK